MMKFMWNGRLTKGRHRSRGRRVYRRSQSPFLYEACRTECGGGSFYTAAYTGVTGGLVILGSDDNGCHSSQNEQDSRYHGKGAGVPVLEPANAQECKDFMKYAYELSEKYDTPVLMRSNTRISHSRGIVTVGEREERENKPYEKNIQKYVAMPAMAKKLHIAQEKRLYPRPADCPEEKKAGSLKEAWGRSTKAFPKCCSEKLMRKA